MAIEEFTPSPVQSVQNGHIAAFNALNVNVVPPSHEIDDQVYHKKLMRRVSSVPFAGKNSNMAQFDCLERPLSQFFYKYGRFISRVPLPFILFPLLMTAALAVGFLHKNEIEDAVYLFTPKNARSKYERQVVHENWPLHETNYVPGRAVTQSRETQVIAKVRDDKDNILEPHFAESVDRLNKFIKNRIFIEHEGQLWGYKNLCLRWRDQNCLGNAQINLVNDLYASRINMTFPTMRFGSKRIYLASSMGGVTLKKGADFTNLVAGAKAWMLLFHLQFKPNNYSYVSGLWEQELERRLLAYRDPYIELTFFHSQTLSEELKRNADTLVPRFVVSFSLLIAFAVGCSFTFIKGRFVIDWVVSKPTLALCGVLSAGMGVISALGLLSYVGMPYNQIVSVMPFLVVAIGVDNMFLMVAALRRTDRSLPADKRIAEALSDAAISISITAITDALSFGVGAITTIPAVQIFCVYTCVAIVFTFLYQLTFFVGLAVIQIKMEEKGQHCSLFFKTVHPEEISKSLMTNLFKLGSRPDPNVSSSTGLTNSFVTAMFRDWYAPVLMQPVVKALVLVWFAIYLAFGVYGCTLLREGLEPINLLVRDSYAIPHYYWLEKYFWPYGAGVQVVVNNVPDMSDLAERQKMMNMVEAFSNTRHTIGMDGVEFWFIDFQHFIEKELSLPITSLDHSFYKLARHFFLTNTYEQWNSDVVWNNNSENARITAFRFLVGMKDFQKTTDQRETTELLREVADSYPRYNVTTFMPLWMFTDQYQLILPNTIQNILIALGAMFLISLLLIPQPLCAFLVVVAIASIDVGVVGYMTHWGVNLDAISMITIIMSIGFSVDFSAHISYGYVVSSEKDPTDRVRMALGALGWPILQGALSTIIGVVVLSTVDAYMIVTFFKTVFLVITIGAIHGLVFLPVLLSIFVRNSCTSKKSEKRSRKDKVGPAYPPPNVFHVRDIRANTQHR